MYSNVSTYFLFLSVIIIIISIIIWTFLNHLVNLSLLLIIIGIFIFIISFTIEYNKLNCHKKEIDIIQVSKPTILKFYEYYID